MKISGFSLDWNGFNGHWVRRHFLPLPGTDGIIDSGLIAYDADTGARTDLPGPGLFNMCLAINPVNGELWGSQNNVIYSINKTDGTFVNEGTITPSAGGEACSFDLSGRFLIVQGTSLLRSGSGYEPVYFPADHPCPARRLRHPAGWSLGCERYRHYLSL